MVFKAMLSRSVRLQEARLWSRVSDLEARTAKKRNSGIQIVHHTMQQRFETRPLMHIRQCIPRE